MSGAPRSCFPGTFLLREMKRVMNIPRIITKKSTSFAKLTCISVSRKASGQVELLDPPPELLLPPRLGAMLFRDFCVWQ
jgi:hypothetical protein